MDQNTFALIAEQLYAKLSQDLQHLSLNVQQINSQIPNLTNVIGEIRSKVQNCESITLANAVKLEAVNSIPPTPDPSTQSATSSRRTPRITKKMLALAKSVYVTDFIENTEMHESYKKKLEAAEIDAEEIPEYLQRQAEKLFEGFSREEQAPFIKKARDMVNT
jgi:type I site-specific restriction endonuclease